MLCSLAPQLAVSLSHSLPLCDNFQVAHTHEYQMLNVECALVATKLHGEIHQMREFVEIEDVLRMLLLSQKSFIKYETVLSIFISSHIVIRLKYFSVVDVLFG